MVINGEGAPIGAPFPRELPLGAIETLLNEPQIYEQIIRRNDERAPHYEVTEAISHFRLEQPRKGAAKVRRPTRTKASAERRPTTHGPGSRTLSDTFFAELADCYVYAVANGERPLIAIEREASVPRNTATRWVAMARRRGFLATDSTIKEYRKERGGRNSSKRPQTTRGQ